MPIHEYSCPLGHVTEVFVGKEEVPEDCPHSLTDHEGAQKCSLRIHRVIGKTDFSLKGPRWEKDGYSGTGTGTTTTTRRK